MATSPKYLLLGEILRPHGIRGELRMRVLTDYPERISSLEQVFVGKSPNATNARQYTVQHMRMHKTYGLLKLKGLDDRDDSERLRGLFVMIRLEDAVPLNDDEVYLYQLIGMNVITDEGQTLGIITDVLETGANDVYIVKGEAYGEILIPVINETILNTDVESNTLTIKLLDGLLP